MINRFKAISTPAETDLVVRTAREVLRLVRVVSDALEHVDLEQREHAYAAQQVPDDA